MTSYLAQQVLNGIQLGAIYALIALGYTMVYGIIKLINFAHADIFMVGAYAAFFTAAFYIGNSPQFPFWLLVWVSIVGAYLLAGQLTGKLAFLRHLAEMAATAPARARSGFMKGVLLLLRPALDFALLMIVASVLLPVLQFCFRAAFLFRPKILLFPAVILASMGVCALLGCAIEKAIYRPLRYRPRLSVLISALGASLFLENFASLDIAFGNSYRAFPEIVPRREIMRIAALDISITSTFLLNIAVIALLLTALWFLVEKTLIGKQMRAVSYDKNAAVLMGIDIDKVISVTFMIGASLAGVSGVLYAMNYGVLQSPFFGFSPGIKAFIAAVLGGIGSLPGAVLGGFIMGISEVFANSIDSNLGFAAAFLVLIIILLVKPTGLLGKSNHEKL